MTVVGSVQACWRFPVKSLQGHEVQQIEVGESGVVGDRQWGFMDTTTNKLMSAKRFSALLGAVGHEDHVELPGGQTVRLNDPEAAATLSSWLGTDLTVVRPNDVADAAYQMTFDPPNDDAEYVDIPTPTGTFLDLAAVHIVSTATLAHCRAQRPELDWDVRRFRPNILVELDDAAAGFTEDQWVGRRLQVGDAVLQVLMPTVRCAMPLRAQPGGLARQPSMFGAMSELNTDNPNHLGIYLDVVQPGAVRAGNPVELLDE